MVTTNTRISTARKTLTPLLAILIYLIYSCYNKNTAYSLPDYFPDLSHYKPVNPEQYFYIYPNNAKVIFFKNAQNVACSFDFGELESCKGFFSHNLSVTNHNLVCQKIIQFNDEDRPAQISILPDKECNDIIPSKVIPAGYKISFKGNTCAIGENNLIACTNTRHGFIISNTQTQIF